MKKTKFDKNVQNITFKPDTCLNSGEYPFGGQSFRLKIISENVNMRKFS